MGSLLRTLLALCERAKRMLSTAVSAELTLENIYENLDLQCTITRSRFENLCEKLFVRCMEPIQQVLRDSKIPKELVDEVLLVGGSSRIPKVRSMVSKYFEKPVNTSVSPDEAVAYGAAVQACIITNNLDDVTEDMLLVDVIPLSLGIKTAGDLMSVFIKRNSPIPVKITKFYSTDIDNQEAVDICIYEGERLDVRENHFLGKVSLENIPPKPAGVPRIKVTFSLDQDGILDVSAIEQLSNTQCSIKLVSGYGSGRLTYDDVQKIVQDAEQFAKEDQYLRDIKRTRLECETLCQQVKGALPFLLTYLDETAQLRVLQALDDCNAWISVNSDANPDDFTQAHEKLLKKVDSYLSQAYDSYIAAGGDLYPNGPPPGLDRVHVKACHRGEGAEASNDTAVTDV
uniref:Heat shock 70 kDa protein 1 n=1 Tax=Lygus hesperus TaxID=30085 RepID=A0A0A9WZ35_LYGHE